MAIENLGDFLSSSYQKSFLQRIYIGQKFQDRVSRLTKDKVRVVIKDKALTIFCVSAAQATYLKLERKKLYGILNEILNNSNHGIVIRIRVGV